LWAGFFHFTDRVLTVGTGDLCGHRFRHFVYGSPVGGSTWASEIVASSA
jgi:hypothetical protein